MRKYSLQITDNECECEIKVMSFNFYFLWKRVEDDTVNYVTSLSI